MAHVAQPDVLEQRRKVVEAAKERADRTIAALSPDTETYRIVTLAARVGYALAKEEDGAGSLCPPEQPQHVYCALLAAKRFPLPPKRVLREEPDPCGGDVDWRWTGALEYRPNGGAKWNLLISDSNGRVFAPYPERIDLWHSLKHEPYREVPDNDNGDE